MTDNSGFTIGILLFEDVEELDMAGPFEVFGVALKSVPNGKLVTVSESGESLRCFNGLRVLPDYDFSDCPPLDMILVPGGMGTRTQVSNPKLIEWLADISSQCTWVTSVCTGSLLLSAAGQTEGRRITTHWAFAETLRELYPNTTVIENARYVCDENLVTAAGVSAGIDMSLWLVGQIWSIDLAQTTQRMISAEHRTTMLGLEDQAPITA